MLGTALSLGYNDIYRDRNPEAYRTLARWFGQSTANIRLPVVGLSVTAAVRLPEDPQAINEALLTTGRPGAEDCLFMEYKTGRAARFGHARPGTPMTYSAPMTFIPGRDYRLDIWYGASSRQLVIRMDGAVVWNEATILLPSSADEITVGLGPASLPDIRPFSGDVRVPPQGGSLYAAGQRTAFPTTRTTKAVHGP